MIICLYEKHHNYIFSVETGFDSLIKNVDIKFRDKFYRECSVL